jgi:sugar/nucleoside kinase (ribokinase family)
MRAPDVVCLGVLILDVLGRPCPQPAPGQTGTRIEQLRMTAAGTAAGTAVDLAKLGARTRVVGCVGDDDIGDMLLALLRRHGIDISAVRRDRRAQTSASLLPVRPDGERIAYHVIGANARLSLTDGELAHLLAGADHLHVGGPDSMGPFLSAGLRQVLSAARDAGVGTSLDLLGARVEHARDPVRAALPLVDYFTPNEHQLAGLYGTGDVVAGCAAALSDGAGLVAVSLGAEGCLLAWADERVWLPAYDVPVVDTTGCGDAFTAGFLRGALMGWDPPAAARLGCAAGALVAGGLGSDAGIVDLAGTINGMETLPPRRPAARPTASSAG